MNHQRTSLHRLPSIADMPGQNPQLPMELLVEEIIPHLDTWQDRKTLKALAQTCHAFVVPSQRILFEDLSWGEGTNHNGWVTAYNLNDHLDASPHLANYFRHVLLCLTELPTAEDPRCQIQGVFWNLRHVETLELSSYLSPRSFSELCLNRFNLGTGDLDGGMKNSILRLIQQASLKHLTLTNVNLDVSDLALSSIRVLRLRDGHISADNDDASGSTKTTSIEKIEIRWSDDSSTRSLETVLRFAKNLSSCSVTVDGMWVLFFLFLDHQGIG